MNAALFPAILGLLLKASEEQLVCILQASKLILAGKKWVPEKEAKPEFYIREEYSRQRRGKTDRTRVSTWRIGFQGQEVLLPPWLGAEFLILLIARQGKNYSADRLMREVRKCGVVAPSEGQVKNGVFGDDGDGGKGNGQNARVGPLNERDVVMDEKQIAVLFRSIAEKTQEKEAHEAAGDYSSAVHGELTEEIEKMQDLLKHNTKLVNGKLAPKEYQISTTKEQADLIGKHFRKLLNKFLRNNCRSLFDHLNDKNTLAYGMNNSYHPKPAIAWHIQYQESKKGTQSS